MVDRTMKCFCKPRQLNLKIVMKTCNFLMKLILLKYNSTKVGRNSSIVTTNLFKTSQRPVFPPKYYFKTASHGTVSEAKTNRRCKNFHFLNKFLQQKTEERWKQGGRERGTEEGRERGG